MEPNNEYHFSFFKPTTPQAKSNRNMVVYFVIIWAVAIFGFQFLLRITEKPTPEAALTTFESVWDNVKNETASTAELQDFAKSTLSVLGKTITIKPDDKKVFDNALSWSVRQLLTDSLQCVTITQDIKDFEAISAEITNISDIKYVSAKKSLSKDLSTLVGLDPKDVRTELIPLEVVSNEMQSFSNKNKEAVVKGMRLYLTHNQSKLTDIKFLGFPFHYFYTAVFLLILFVGLCLLYCVKTDKLNAKYNNED